MTIPPAMIHHYVSGTTRNILAGGGICFAVENQRYLEVPLALVFPSIYTGYHLYKNRDQIAQWIKVFHK
jgi:hypothetical protein